MWKFCKYTGVFKLKDLLEFGHERQKKQIYGRSPKPSCKVFFYHVTVSL